MFDPLITIVVPTYNRAKLIPATLKSLQSQYATNYEIIIVDDGSTDDTDQVVTPFLNDYTRYVKKDNAERAAARNYGAMLASGQYLNFFDSDDLALSNHISEAADLIYRNNEPEWFHLAYEWVNPQGFVFKKVNHFTGDTLNAKMKSGNQLSCNGVFVRRDIFINNQFNEDRALSASEDYELWLRLSARYPLRYSNIITSQVVDHDSRSVRTISAPKLISRLECFVHYLEQDEKVLKYFGSSFRQIRMDAWSYISLHLADQRGWKVKSISYLFRALGQSATLILTKRFYAIIKNILLKW